MLNNYNRCDFDVIHLFRETTFYTHVIICSNEPSEVKLPSYLPSMERITAEEIEISSQYQVEEKRLGMWVMSFKRSSIDNNWEKACNLYRERSLPGITRIKSQLVKFGHEGLLMFFCGPLDDETLVLSYGHSLMEKMEYMRKLCFKADTEADSFSDVIYTIKSPSTPTSVPR